LRRISKLLEHRSLLRRGKQKLPRSITLIVCEGETEQIYFEAARIKYGLTTAEITLADNTVGPAPISVVQCAEGKCAERGGYDKVFCVFDRDGHESFDRARNRIKSLADRKKNPLPIKEAISVPCFEFWVLLHFERTDPPFERCAAAIQRIRDQHHMPEYEKADATVAGKLMAKVEDAIGNADWVEGRAENNAYNPYTSVHHVLKHFSALAAQGENP
jgi:hypothetical protein